MCFADTYYGNLNNRTVNNFYGVRPGAYLDLNLIVTGGTGTESNPWVIE